MKWLFYLSVLCRRLAHDVIVWKHWPTSCLFSSFVHVFVWIPYTRLFETCLIWLYFRESVSGDLFFIKTFPFLYKNVNENRNKRVCISVNFVIWFEVFSDKECTAWYRYYRWCWFMSLCSAFGIVLFQDLRIFFSGNKSDYHFFCLTLKYSTNFWLHFHHLLI